MVVTEYIDGLGFDEIARLDEAERDRIAEIMFRFLFGLVWREHVVLGDSHRQLPRMPGRPGLPP